jgi:hypothetical protein
MKKNLSFKARLLSFLFLSLFIHVVNSQITLWPFKDAAGKWGFKNNTEKIIIPSKYNNCDDSEKALLRLN